MLQGHGFLQEDQHGHAGEVRGTSRRTIFSPSPIHLEVSDDAEMAKNVARMFAATALPSSVFPVPARRARAHLSLATHPEPQP